MASSPRTIDRVSECVNGLTNYHSIVDVDGNRYLDV